MKKLLALTLIAFLFTAAAFAAPLAVKTGQNVWLNPVPRSGITDVVTTGVATIKISWNTEYLSLIKYPSLAGVCDATVEGNTIQLVIHLGPEWDAYNDPNIFPGMMKFKTLKATEPEGREDLVAFVNVSLVDKNGNDYPVVATMDDVKLIVTTDPFVLGCSWLLDPNLIDMALVFPSFSTAGGWLLNAPWTITEDTLSCVANNSKDIAAAYILVSPIDLGDGNIDEPLAGTFRLTADVKNLTGRMTVLFITVSDNVASPIVPPIDLAVGKFDFSVTTDNLVAVVFQPKENDENSGVEISNITLLKQ